MNFFHLLTLVFVLAKLTNHFPYSWWLVFTPSIVGVLIGLSLTILAAIIAVSAAEDH